MGDHDWRAAERRWRADPTDQASLAAAIDSVRRAGLRPPPTLLDAQLDPPTSVDVPLPVEVWAVLPDGTTRTICWGPGRVDVPACRVWGVTSQWLTLEHLAALGAFVRERRVPGLRLGDERDSKDLDRAALEALGAQPHLRSLALPERGIHRFHVDDVLGKAGCTELRAFAVDYLTGPERGRDEVRAQAGLLQGLHRLRDLRLDACALRPDDLASLDGLTELDRLSLSSNRDVAVAHAAALACARSRSAASARAS